MATDILLTLTNVRNLQNYSDRLRCYEQAFRASNDMLLSNPNIANVDWVLQFVKDVFENLRDRDADVWLHNQWSRLFIDLDFAVNQNSKEGAQILDKLTPWLLNKGIDHAIQCLQETDDPESAVKAVSAWGVALKFMGQQILPSGKANKCFSLFPHALRFPHVLVVREAFRSWKMLIKVFAADPNWRTAELSSEYNAKIKSRVELVMRMISYAGIKPNSFRFAKSEIAPELFDCWWFCCLSLGPRLVNHFEETTHCLLRFVVGVTVEYKSPNEQFELIYRSVAAPLGPQLVALSNSKLEADRYARKPLTAIPELWPKLLDLLESLIISSEKQQQQVLPFHNATILKDHCVFVIQCIRFCDQKWEEGREDLEARILALFFELLSLILQNQQLSSTERSFQLVLFLGQFVDWMLETRMPTELLNQSISRLDQANVYDQIVDSPQQRFGPFLQEIDAKIETLKTKMQPTLADIDPEKLVVSKEKLSIIQEVTEPSDEGSSNWQRTIGSEFTDETPLSAREISTVTTPRTALPQQPLLQSFSESESEQEMSVTIEKPTMEVEPMLGAKKMVLTSASHYISFDQTQSSSDEASMEVESASTVAYSFAGEHSKTIEKKPILEVRPTSSAKTDEPTAEEKLEEKEQTQMAEEGQIAACQNGTGNEEGMAKMEDKTEEKEVNITKSAETVDVSPKQQAVEEEKKQPSLIMSEEQPEAVQPQEPPADDVNGNEQVHQLEIVEDDEDEGDADDKEKEGDDVVADLQKMLGMDQQKEEEPQQPSTPEKQSDAEGGDGGAGFGTKTPVEEKLAKEGESGGDFWMTPQKLTESEKSDVFGTSMSAQPTSSRASGWSSSTNMDPYRLCGTPSALFDDESRLTIRDETLATTFDVGMETREVTTTTATTVATFEDKTGTPSRTGMQSPSMVVNSTGINQADEEEKKQQQIVTAEIDVTQTPSTLMKFTDEIQEQVESTNSNTEGGGERVAEEEAEIMDGLCSAVDEGPKNGEEEDGKSNNNNVGMEEEAGTNVVDGSKSPESIFTPLRQTAKATTAASSTTTPQAEPMQKEATPTSILRKTSSPARKSLRVQFSVEDKASPPPRTPNRYRLTPFLKQSQKRQMPLNSSEAGSEIGTPVGQAQISIPEEVEAEETSSPPKRAAMSAFGMEFPIGGGGGQQQQQQRMTPSSASIVTASPSTIPVPVFNSRLHSNGGNRTRKSPAAFSASTPSPGKNLRASSLPWSSTFSPAKTMTHQQVQQQQQEEEEVSKRAAAEADRERQEQQQQKMRLLQGVVDSVLDRQKAQLAEEIDRRFEDAKAQIMGALVNIIGSSNTNHDVGNINGTDTTGSDGGQA